MDKHEIATTLKNMLDAVGLSQVWAAKQLGITPAYLNRVVGGEKLPSDDLAKKMELLTGTLESSGLISVNVR